MKALYIKRNKYKETFSFLGPRNEREGKKLLGHLAISSEKDAVRENRFRTN